MGKRQYTQTVMNWTDDGNRTYIRASLIKRKTDEPKFDVIQLSIRSESLQDPVVLNLAPEEALEAAAALSAAVRNWLLAAPLYRVYREIEGSPAHHAAAHRVFEE